MKNKIEIIAKLLETETIGLRSRKLEKAGFETTFLSCDRSFQIGTVTVQESRVLIQASKPKVMYAPALHVVMTKKAYFSELVKLPRFAKNPVLTSILYDLFFDTEKSGMVESSVTNEYIITPYTCSPAGRTDFSHLITGALEFLTVPCYITEKSGLITVKKNVFGNK